MVAVTGTPPQSPPDPVHRVRSVLSGAAPRLRSRRVPCGDGGQDLGVGAGRREGVEAPPDVAAEQPHADAVGDGRQPGGADREVVAPDRSVRVCSSGSTGVKFHPPEKDPKNQGPRTIFIPTRPGGGTSRTRTPSSAGGATGSTCGRPWAAAVAPSSRRCSRTNGSPTGSAARRRSATVLNARAGSRGTVTVDDTWARRQCRRSGRRSGVARTAGPPSGRARRF